MPKRSSFVEQGLGPVKKEAGTEVLEAERALLWFPRSGQRRMHVFSLLFAVLFHLRGGIYIFFLLVLSVWSTLISSPIRPGAGCGRKSFFCGALCFLS